MFPPLKKKVPSLGLLDFHSRSVPRGVRARTPRNASTISLYSQLLRRVRLDPSAETSCAVYPLLVRSCISFCLLIRSMGIEPHASLTPCRHIQGV